MKLFNDFYIEDDKNLECILNSNDEDNPYGNQISKKDIIETHNKYISNFIDCVQKNKLSKYWEKFLCEKKLIQNLFSEYNFFIFDEEKINAEKFNNLYEIIYNNSSQDVIYKKNKFYFKNYKEIKYNLSKIENLLEQSFLIGKSYFKEEQIFIEFNQFDPLSKNLFTDYNKQFEQKHLEEYTKKNIKELLKKYKDNENEKKDVLKYIKRLMKLIKSNNLFYKNDDIIIPEIPKKQFETIPKLFDEILQLRIRNEWIIDLYEFIELSIIFDKYYNYKNNDDKFQDIKLSDSTVTILRKFYLRFIYDNEVNKGLPINEVIFENKDLFFEIPNNQEIKEDNKNNVKNIDKIKGDIQTKLLKYKVNDCLAIYLNNISQDKELEKYSNIGKKSNEPRNPQPGGSNVPGTGKKKGRKTN